MTNLERQLTAALKRIEAARRVFGNRPVSLSLLDDAAEFLSKIRLQLFLRKGN